MKRIILSLGLILSLSSVFSQNFMQGAGVSFIGASPTDNGSFLGVALTYSPRINFYETEKYSISLGVPISFGVSTGNRNLTDTTLGLIQTYPASYSGTCIYVPIHFNFNIGRGSSKTNNEKLGYFLGAGYGFYSASYNISSDYATGNGTDHASTSTSGLNIDGGMRFGVGRGHKKHPKNIEVSVSYTKGSSILANSIYGVGCSFNF